MEKIVRQPGTAQTHFSKVPRADVERSRFDRSHGHKTTLNGGYLVPVFVDEVLPGDSFHLKETSFARLNTPLKPVMDNMYLESFYFFVPYRLVWDNWQMFCGERRSPSDDPTTKSIPQVSVPLTGLAHDDLMTYLGMPIGVTGTVDVSALPLRAYHLVYNEWFRDQNLIDPIAVETGDTNQAVLAGWKCQRRGKRHDYFTSALPWPQKGAPVMIPVGDVGIVPESPGYPVTAKAGPSGASAAIQIEATSKHLIWAGASNATTVNLVWDDPKLQQDLAAATGATINDLRQAFQIQRLLERDARGGTRYIELVLAHFGVHSDDARLQRPEYLGGGSSRINISPVPATFAGTEVAQGDLAGFGTAVNRGGFSKSFTEHGIIIGIACVRADLNYQNGIERFWHRKTRYDFYWPALAHLGEQAIYNKELKFEGSPVADEAVFGYQERYAEYRYKPSRVSGRFMSQDPQSLDVWHLAYDFVQTPLLNKAFIEETPQIDRIVAVPTQPHFLLDIWFDLKCDRPMPVYSVPGMSDHF